AVAVLLGINPPRPTELAEVEPQVRKAELEARAADIVQAKSAEAAELLKQNGGDIKAAAKAVGGEVTSTDFIGRSGALEGIGSAAVISDAFDKPVGSIF